MKPTDLIVNPDGTIYHLKLRPDELPDMVLVVGDPGRVKQISNHFDFIHFRRQNREFISHFGSLNGRHILALSTGIGPDNMDIVINELDALANIDLEKRVLRDITRTLKIVRLGTSGTIQSDIAVGSMAVASHGLGLDGSLHYYDRLKDVTDRDLTDTFIRETSWPAHLPSPYMIRGSDNLIRRLESIAFRGITATAGGFYGPQGRELRLESSFPELLSRLTSFSYHGLRIVNFEMETSSLYGLGRMLGHQVASICVMLANRTTGEYSSNVNGDVEKLVSLVLEQLTG